LRLITAVTIVAIVAAVTIGTVVVIVTVGICAIFVVVIDFTQLLQLLKQFKLD
jgi:hypothetical protein